jgi:hypothetical protein
MDIRTVCNLISGTTSVALLTMMGVALYCQKKQNEIDRTIAAGNDQLKAWDEFIKRNNVLQIRTK